MSLEAHHRIHEGSALTERFDAIHSKRSVRIIDRWVLVVGIAAPFSMLPQIVQVLVSHSSAGISLTTWVLFCVFALFWLVYGIAHEEVPIIVTNSLWVVGELTLIGVVLMYR